jgi:hypothetical protein
LIVAPDVYADQLVPLFRLYSYRSAAPVDPPDPEVIVAIGPLYPAHIDVPLVGVAAVNTGFTVAVPNVHVHMVLHPVAVQP